MKKQNVLRDAVILIAISIMIIGLAQKYNTKSTKTIQTQPLSAFILENQKNGYIFNDGVGVREMDGECSKISYGKGQSEPPSGGIIIYKTRLPSGEIIESQEVSHLVHESNCINGITNQCYLILASGGSEQQTSFDRRKKHKIVGGCTF